MYYLCYLHASYKLHLLNLRIIFSFINSKLSQLLGLKISAKQAKGEKGGWVGSSFIRSKVETYNACICPLTHHNTLIIKHYRHYLPISYPSCRCVGLVCACKNKVQPEQSRTGQQQKKRKDKHQIYTCYKLPIGFSLFINLRVNGVVNAKFPVPYHCHWYLPLSRSYSSIFSVESCIDWLSELYNV